jgi:hypothetical protein
MELEASAGKPTTSPAARLGGLKGLVDGQKPAFIGREPGVLQGKAVGVADATRSNHDGVRLDLAAVAQRHRERRSRAHPVDPSCLDQIDAGVHQALLQERRDLGIEKR